MVQAHKVTREDMELDEGLPDDFIGTITEDTVFEINQEYADAAGEEIPMLAVYIDSPQYDTPIRQMYSTGKGRKWKIKNNGKEVVSEVNPDAHRFIRNSRAGQLIARIFELVGEGDRVKGQDILMSRYGDKGYYMTQVPFITGLTFHWKRETLSALEGRTSDVLLPVRYIGNSTNVAPNATATSTKTGQIATEEEIAKIVAASVDEATGTPLTLSALRKAILKIPELKSNKVLMNEIFNKGFLDTLIADGILFLAEEE